MKVALIGSTNIFRTALAAVIGTVRSLEDMRDAISDALMAKFGKSDVYSGPKYYLVETFPDYVIVSSNDNPDDMYQVPYSIDAQGNIVFGDLRPVEVAYLPVTARGEFATQEAAAGGDDWTFPVVMMKAGFANGTVEHAGKKVRQYFDEDIIRQVALASNGGRFGRRHPMPGENENAMPERIAGWLDNGRLVGSGDQAMAVTDIHLLKSETKLQQTLLAAREANKLDLYGVSVLAYFGYTPAVVGGEPVLRATKLAKFSSLDWCAEPAAGGRFLDSVRTAASRDLPRDISTMQSQAVKPQPSGGTPPTGANNVNFKDRILTLLAALRKKNAGRAAELESEFKGLSEDKHGEFLTKMAEEGINAMPAPAVIDPANDPAKTALAESQAALAKATKIQAETLIQTKLSASKLTGPALEYLKTSFAGRVNDGGEITEQYVDGEISRARDAFAAYSTVGRVRSIGVALESIEKVQLAMDGLFALKNDQKVAPFRGLREAYIHLTGDSELRFDNGGFFRTSEAAIQTSDFPNLLLNSMTKRLLQDFAEVGMGGLDQLITTGAPVADYKTQDRVREGYLVDLSSVSEGADYAEIAHPTDEKVSYAVAKRGNILSITEETIRTDDLGAVARFPGRLARSARRTLKQYITNFFVNNPNYGVDSVAWFHATHGNLGSVALSIDELTARDIALMSQTEKDSSKPLGLMLNWLMVPKELKAAAWKINRAEFYNPGPGIKEPNPWYGKFGANEERIIVNELLSDTNDWYYGSAPNEAPFLEIGYLDGYQTPQILLANLPTQGTAFTADKLQYKVKFVFGGVPIDFRGVGKNVVA
jgi:hypothetical protein